jgi:hypothetical protein
MLAVAAVTALVLAACSSPTSRPDQFDDLTADEVGCVVAYGDDAPRVVGPLGPSDSQDITPNDYTSFRIARTASDIIIVAEQPVAASNLSMPLNDIPPNGIVARGLFINGGNPGYIITCWRGNG